MSNLVKYNPMVGSGYDDEIVTILRLKPGRLMMIVHLDSVQCTTGDNLWIGADLNT